jgi:hypothetical protein
MHASDVMLLVDFVLAVLLAGYFALGHPRVWYKDRLGWVIFGYAVTTIAFVGLIAYAIVFGQKVDEPVRFGVSPRFTRCTLSAEKDVSQRRTPLPPRRIPMSTPSTEQVKDATTIWYKGQRVLRSLFQTVIPAFLGFALVLPAIIEASGLPVDSELRLWFVAVAAGVTAVAGAISRIMAIPAVNAFFTKFGLGSVPRGALAVEKDFRTDEVVNVYVMRDPKAKRDD